MKKLMALRAVALTAALGGALPLWAAAPVDVVQQTPPPDNTKVNKQGGTTADKQSQTKADLALVKNIRAAIVKDKTLSMNGHNCKVITRDGNVLLRGPVNSQTEKDAIAAIAAKFAGTGTVTNELVVKAPK